jgi:hypothetical protein
MAAESWCSSDMVQAGLTRIQAVDLARRIQGLPVAEQAKLLARVMLAEGKKAARSAIRAIQHRAGTPRTSADAVELKVVKTVRAVRSGRAPQPR